MRVKTDRGSVSHPGWMRRLWIRNTQAGGNVDVHLSSAYIVKYPKPGTAILSGTPLAPFVTRPVPDLVPTALPQPQYLVVWFTSANVSLSRRRATQVRQGELQRQDSKKPGCQKPEKQRTWNQWLVDVGPPSKTVARHQPAIGLMSGHRRRRWPDINQPLGQHLIGLVVSQPVQFPTRLRSNAVFSLRGIRDPDSEQIPNHLHSRDHSGHLP